MDVVSPLRGLPSYVTAGCTTPFLTDADAGCQRDIRKADENDERAFGDPLLGPQDSVRPDGRFWDRGGDPSPNVRGIVYGDAWASWFYDQSVLITTTMVSALGCPSDPASPNALVLAACRFVDVDLYPSYAPLVGAILQDQLKPAARGAWLFVRDNPPGAGF